MINWRSIKYFPAIVLCSAVCIGCFQSDYTTLVKSELAKNVRRDSVLLGISLGETRNVFYGKCFDLNKLKLITPGHGNSSVMYLFTDSVFHEKPTELRLLFYPTFDKQDIIAEVKMEFSYPGWAPWNRSLQSDSLRQKVEKLLMHWYKGNDFVDAHINERTVPVKVDGNRRITVNVEDAQTVQVRVQDLLHPYFMHSITRNEK
jgi:hypothetical protein